MSRTEIRPATSPDPVATPAAPHRRRTTWHWLAPALLVSVAALLAASLMVGNAISLSVGDLWTWLVHRDDLSRLHQIAIDARAPRALLAALAGVCLGSAGAMLQALTRNPLASPEITGVTAGAVAAVLCLLAFGPTMSALVLNWWLPMAAVCGGLLAAAVVYGLSMRVGTLESTRFIMIGILFGGVLSSFSSFALIFLGVNADRVLGWLAGSLSLKTWTDLEQMALYVAPGFALTLLAVPRANALQLGDDVALALGQRRHLDRLLVLMASVVLASGTVAVVGGIGFIGLVAPHMVRRAVGSDLRRLVPAAGLAGAAMVLVADLLARNFDPRWLLGSLGDQVTTASLPVGVYLQCFGVPFLVILLWRRRDR